MLTTQDFLKLLQGLQGQDSIQDVTQLRYVIYARKSTTESEERQVRSLGDQVVECTELAQKMGLKVVRVIKEAESAKEPDIRPKFREMVEEIKKGKYEGIIAWHPDRLARNMKDAGEIIDLLDKHIIKDLHFVSFTFQNNTAGKMLLGIAFVLSKQYSDQLSDNVKRGIRRSIEEGKYLSRTKYGYYKDINKFLRPDGDNFTLLKAGWKMRLDGLTQEVVMKYLNDNGFTRAVDSTGDKHELYKWGRSRISEMFKDPFYTGVLKYGEQFVDLTEIYDFVPMITVDDFLKGVFSADLKDLDKKLKEADDQLEAIKKELELNKKAILSYSQFLELFSELPVRIRKTKVLRELDFMIRKIFLNFRIKDKIVASYQLNQPFDRFIKDDIIPTSRGGEN